MVERDRLVGGTAVIVLSNRVGGCQLLFIVVHPFVSGVLSLVFFLSLLVLWKQDFPWHYRKKFNYETTLDMDEKKNSLRDKKLDVW